MANNIVSIRISDSLKKLLDKTHPMGFTGAVKEILDCAMVDESYWQSKIELLKGQIAFCEEMMKTSPLYSGYTFTKEEHEYLMLHYTNALRAGKPEILFENVYRGYNKITGSRLSLKQYQRVVKKWLRDNKLEFHAGKGEQ